MTLYTYKAVVDRWVDGDTVDLVVDLGFNMTTKQRFRVMGIDTPERNEVNYDVARMCSEEMHPRGSAITFTSVKGKDKYGRWLIELPELVELLKSRGLGKAMTM